MRVREKGRTKGVSNGFAGWGPVLRKPGCGLCSWFLRNTQICYLEEQSTLFLWLQKYNYLISIMGLILCIYYYSMLSIFTNMFRNEQAFYQVSPEEEEQCCP